MARSYKEVWLALLAAALIAALYGWVVWSTRTIPAAAGLFGHSIGVVGFLLMLSTETLYSLRKRSRLARFGRLSTWLKVHIFTGLVGPFMVLLHTAGKLNGLAGVTTLLTVLIVISGFAGRYIYTRIPRTLDGVEIENDVSRELLVQSRRVLSLWHTIHIPIGLVLFTLAFIHLGAALYYSTFLR
ncbi:MAG TPA: hypothetical protein VFF68_00385 [Anaerolineaceae bacterium]|nr:hypothetical protein [Anaerolineaceae bacterium]